MYGGSEKLRRCLCPNRVWRQKVLLLILLRDAIYLDDTWKALKQSWKKTPYVCVYICIERERERVPNSGLIFADVNLD